MKELKYKEYGQGNNKLFLLHDWFSDSSSYDLVLSSFDPAKYHIVLPDLRGYGLSKEIKGNYTLDEIITDIFALAKKLQWQKFSIAGHSMCGMAMLKLPLHPDANEISKIIAITPVTPYGGQMPEPVNQFCSAAASDNLEFAGQIVANFTGQKLTAYFCQEKAKKWHKVSTSQARLGYLKMFNQTDFSQELKTANIASTPVLIITGKNDDQSMNYQAHENKTLPLIPHAKIVEITDAGHYPMEETPKLLAGIIAAFLAEKAS